MPNDGAPTFAQKRMPLVIRLGVCFIVFGAFFPIYGIAVPTVGKLTFFRIGLAAMLLAAPFLPYRKDLSANVRNRLTACLIGFIMIRAFSLCFSTWEAFAVGFRMLEWFIECALAAYCIACAVQRYPQLLRTVLNLVFFLGGAGTAVLAVQFLQFKLTGSVFALPFSTTIFGVEELLEIDSDLRMNYPLGPGWRVIGAFLESNVAGSFIAMMSVFGVAVFCSKGKLLWRYVGGAVFVSSLLGLWGTGSRQALFYAAIGLAVFLVAQIRYKERPGRVVFAVGVISAALWSYTYYLSSSYESVSASAEDSGDLGFRFARALDEEGLMSMGGRASVCDDLISSLGWNTLLLGSGEGAGHDDESAKGTILASCHNAYLVVLMENGALALVLLCAISHLFLRGSCRIRPDLFPGYRFEITLFRSVLPSWVVIWIASMLLNWTQMNSMECWVFMAIALTMILRKSNMPQVFNAPCERPD